MTSMNNSGNILDDSYSRHFENRFTRIRKIYA